MSLPMILSFGNAGSDAGASASVMTSRVASSISLGGVFS